jgi:hypothetical protein
MHHLLGGMVGFTGLIVSAAVGLFELGLRRYESGNLLGMQRYVLSQSPHLSITKRDIGAIPIVLGKHTN